VEGKPILQTTVTSDKSAAYPPTSATPQAKVHVTSEQGFKQGSKLSACRKYGSKIKFIKSLKLKPISNFTAGWKFTTAHCLIVSRPQHT
jgi:hypothetical protein